MSEYDIQIHNFLTKPVVEFQSLELVKEYYMPDKVYTQKKAKELLPFLGAGLASAEGIEWKNKRKVLSSVFNFELLKSNIPNMI